MQDLRFKLLFNNNLKRIKMGKIFKFLGYAFLGLTILGGIANACDGGGNKAKTSDVSAEKAIEPNKGSCNCEIKPLANRGNDFYFNVSGFDAKNKDCYGYLKQWVVANTGAVQGIGAHYLDNMPDFRPPANNDFYGSERVKKRVILQSVTIGTKREFYFDPLGYGNYEEVK